VAAPTSAAFRARYLARNIPDAKLRELEGDDHVYMSGDADAIIDELEEFLTGARHVHEPDPILATVLFTDIAGSTEAAANLGDRRWRELLEGHHAMVRRKITEYRGREIDTAGDGFLMGFDGPVRGVRCANAIINEARDLGLEVRASLHTGECE
jgi:class 3 adenylate cyclase